tara:strand:+ start:1022 stop:1636 length:615 start_codon:yes stop_codon:yes gene_type:complete
MIVRLYEENPNPKHLKQVVECINDGGVIIYPTDTIYALGCDIENRKGIERVAQIKGVKAEKSDFSFVFYDLSHISEYTKQFNTSVFKLLKRNLPGPFTFILEANNTIPKLFKNKKRTLGIRVPDNYICRSIVEKLTRPIISTSIHDEDEIVEYTTDPELIYEKYQNQIDLMVDGGMGNNQASTVVDLTSGVPEIIRQGYGELEY